MNEIEEYNILLSASRPGPRGKTWESQRHSGRDFLVWRSDHVALVTFGISPIPVLDEIQ